MTTRAGDARGSLLGEYGFQLLSLAFVMAAATCARYGLGPLQETIQTELSLSDNQMALLQGVALTWPLVMLSLPLGILIDRYSRVRLLGAFATLTVVGGVLTAMATGFALLFFARCLVGVMSSAITVAALSLVADMYEPQQRGRAIMVVTMGDVAGMAIAFALGGAVLVLPEAQPNAWQWAVLCFAAQSILVIILISNMREPVRPIIAESALQGRVGWPQLCRYRELIGLLMTGKIMVATAYGAVLTWAAPTMSRNFGLPPDRIGAIIAVSLTVGGILGPIVGGVLADLCQRSGGVRRTMSAVSLLALLTVPLAVFGSTSDVTMAKTLLILFLGIVPVVGVVEMTLTSIVIPAELRGLCLSLLIATGMIFGAGLAPIAVSMLSQLLGGSEKIGVALTIVCAFSGCAGSVAFAFGRRWAPRAATDRVR